MNEFIKFPWLPDWFEWKTQTEEGRTFDHVVMRSNGRPQTVKGVEPLPWYTSKTDPRPRIQFRVDGKLINLYKYELIWMAYHMRPIPEGSDIHHIDFDLTNNTIENLQLLTHEEHAELHSKTRETNQKNNTICSKPVVAVDEHNNIVHRFASTQEAGRHGFGQSHVAAACRGRYNREGNHYYKGYYWFFEQEWLELQ